MKKNYILSIFLVIALSLSAKTENINSVIVNGDFNQAITTGWTTTANCSLVSKSLTPTTTNAALVNYTSTTRLIQTVSGVGSDFELEFSFACPTPASGIRAFNLNVDHGATGASTINLRVLDTKLIQVYNGSAWVTVGTGTPPIEFSTVGTGGSLSDADAVIKAHRMRIVVHNYNNGTLSYDIYLSAANSQTMSWSATGLTAYQYAPTGNLYQVAFANSSASMKPYLVGDVRLTPIVKVAGTPVTNQNIGIDFTTATDVTATDWVGIYNKADGIPTSRSNALAWAYCNSGTTTPDVLAVSSATLSLPGVSTAGNYVAYYLAADGFTVKGKQDFTVSVPTKIKQSFSDVQVKVVDRKLVVNGTNEAVAAYTLTGLKVDVSKRLNFGVYIIKVGNETFKVVVR